MSSTIYRLIPPPSSGRDDVENTAISSNHMKSPTFIHLRFCRVEAKISNVKGSRVRQQATFRLSVNLGCQLSAFTHLPNQLTSDLLSL
jgi:hypothetical protein